MTHWLVYVYKFWAVLKRIREIIKETYQKDKRGFLEVVSGIIINLIIGTAFIFWIALPIPKEEICKTYALSCLNVAKPQLLHVFALAGILFFFTFSIKNTCRYIHQIVSTMIRIQQYYRFVRSSKDKIKQWVLRNLFRLRNKRNPFGANILVVVVSVQTAVIQALVNVVFLGVMLKVRRNDSQL